MKDGAVRLPWKAVTEFGGVIGDFITRDGKMNVADRQKLEEARLFKIIFESHEISAHGDITIEPNPDDPVRVERMFDGFAKERAPGNEKKDGKVCIQKHLRRRK